MSDISEKKILEVLECIDGISIFRGTRMYRFKTIPIFREVGFHFQTAQMDKAIKVTVDDKTIGTFKNKGEIIDAIMRLNDGKKV